VVMWPAEVRAAVPVRDQSRTVASMTSRGGQLAFSHLTPLPFPRVSVHGHGCGPVHRISGHTSTAMQGSPDIVGQTPLLRGRQPTMMAGARRAVTRDVSFPREQGPEPDCHLNGRVARRGGYLTYVDKDREASCRHADHGRNGPSIRRNGWRTGSGDQILLLTRLQVPLWRDGRASPESVATRYAGRYPGATESAGRLYLSRTRLD